MTYDNNHPSRRAASLRRVASQPYEEYHLRIFNNRYELWNDATSTLLATVTQGTVAHERKNPRCCGGSWPIAMPGG